MDIFMPSEAFYLNADYSERKKIRLSIINSPNYSNLQYLENTESCLKSYSISNFINN